ncbi:YncE family protein [Verrucomicrobiota bacterium sgz303538]
MNAPARWIFTLATLALPALAASPKLNCNVSWLGNTYPGATQWVQQDVEAMCVMPDGTVFTNVGWDEAGGNVGEYRDGELVRYAKHTHGWGFNGGKAVAANSRYLFLSCVSANEGGSLRDENTWPPKGLTWFGISRRTRADISKAAPFTGGKGGKGDTLKECFLPVNEVPDKTIAQLAGLAASETELFVSNPHAGKIQVLDAETMQPRREWTVEQPGAIALDRDGTLWMLSEAALLQFDPQSGKVLARLALPAGIRSTAFAISPRGEFLVNDATLQQVWRLSLGERGELREVARHGTQGGIFAAAEGKAPGEFGDGRFNDISALGVDAEDNLFVAQHGSTGGGSTVLESYTRAGKLRWRLIGQEFVDMADVDPADDTQVFTKEERFAMDYVQPRGREWRYAAYTVDPQARPQDPRLHDWSAGAWVRRIAGQRILFVNDMNGDLLQVYRFASGNSGNLALASGLFAKRPVQLKKSPEWPPNQPGKGAWIWRDTNGDSRFDTGEFKQPQQPTDTPAAQGWWVDMQGGVWLATERDGIRYFPQLGLDEHGNPQWDFESMRVFPPPAEFERVNRIRYDVANDVLFLAGTTAEDKNQHWKPSGPVFARYDGWLRGEAKLRWKIVAPYETGAKGHSSCEPMGFDVAGDYVFVPYTGASKALGFSTGHIEVFRAEDGTSVGHMEPSAEIGEIGLQDIRECLRAWRRADGEYLVFLEDDYKAKVVMFRWRL